MGVTGSLIGGIGWAGVVAIATLAGAAAAITTVLLALRSEHTREEEHRADIQAEARDVAREEALQLADVRGKAITDLREEIDDLSNRLIAARNEHVAQLARLQKDVDEARRQALETQQVLAAGTRSLLVWILGQLENDPPRIDAVVRRIREALAQAA